MKTNRNTHISKRSYLLAITIAILVATMLPLRGFAASSATSGQAGFGLSTILKIDNSVATTKGADGSAYQSKMRVASVNTGDQQTSVTTNNEAFTVEDLTIDATPEEVIVAEEVAPVEVAPAVVAPVEVAPDVVAPVVTENTTVSAPAPAVSGLTAFTAKVSNGNSGQITGLYSENILALSVIQQSGDASYVSTAGNTATQFSMASGLGFLAHNYLAGSSFFSLYGGAPIVVVYGDGSTQSYRVSQIRKFQALSPDSPYSDFVDLASGSTLSASDLFYATYGVGGQVVLQTCISAEGNSSWGRLFIIATPAG